jgi:Phage terminase, small subunit
VTAGKAPTGLSARSRRLWTAVIDEYVLSEAELELLRSALVSLDRADDAAKLLQRDGLTTTDRYGGLRPHPAVEIESKNRAMFGRFVAQLGIKAVPEAKRRAGAKPGPRARAAQLRAVD